jgi:hypothetical protein
MIMDGVRLMTDRVGRLGFVILFFLRKARGGIQAAT